MTSPAMWPGRGAEPKRSNQFQILGVAAREDDLQLLRAKTPHAAEESGQHAAVVIEHGIVAVLKQRVVGHAHLFSGNAPAIDAAAEHPVDAAVTMVGAGVAILAKSP